MAMHMYRPRCPIHTDAHPHGGQLVVMLQYDLYSTRLASKRFGHNFSPALIPVSLNLTIWACIPLAAVAAQTACLGRRENSGPEDLWRQDVWQYRGPF